MFHAPLILCCTKSYEVGVRSLHSHQRSLFLHMPYVCFRHLTVAGNSASSFLSALGRLWPSMSCQCHSGRGTRGPCQSAAKRRGNLRTNTAPMTCKKINSLTACLDSGDDASRPSENSSNSHGIRTMTLHCSRPNC